MVVPEGDDEEALYIFATDGSNIVEEYRHDTFQLGGNSGTDLSSGLWYGNLSWSPDGSRILVESLKQDRLGDTAGDCRRGHGGALGVRCPEPCDDGRGRDRLDSRKPTD